jgi:hypothetical protein|tara:strand:- start:315 stop:611 length:297 start_codon:yes stop_codon:yes gene_type:complete
METEIGNPIEYNPRVQNKEPDDSEPLNDHIPHQHPDDQYYYQSPPMQYMQQPHQMPSVNKSSDFLASLDKSAYIVIFLAFILGFFMGKTMQPVILRHG